MRSWIKRALTRTLTVKGSPDSVEHIEVEPSDRLVLGVTFAIASIIVLTVLETVHVVFLGRWNDEIMSAITLLIGTVIGVFFGKHA